MGLMVNLSEKWTNWNWLPTYQNLVNVSFLYSNSLQVFWHQIINLFTKMIIGDSTWNLLSRGLALPINLAYNISKHKVKHLLVPASLYFIHTQLFRIYTYPSDKITSTMSNPVTTIQHPYNSLIYWLVVCCWLVFSLATTASAVPGSSASDSNKPTFTGVGTGSEHVHFWGAGERSDNPGWEKWSG